MSGSSSLILRRVAPSTSALFSRSAHSALRALCRPNRTLATVIPGQSSVSRTDLDHVTQNETSLGGSRVPEWLETGSAPYTQRGEPTATFNDLADVVNPETDVFRTWI